MNYRLVSSLIILVLGSIVSYLINPLTLLLFITIWIDIVLLSYLASAQQVGFELVTLAGLISGLALGSLAGFFFSLIFLPLLLTVLKSIITRSYFPIAPNLNFLSVAIATALAGFLLGPFGFLVAILIALALKYIVSNIINYIISSSLELVFNTINTLFSLGFLYIAKEANCIIHIK